MAEGSRGDCHKHTHLHIWDNLEGRVGKKEPSDTQFAEAVKSEKVRHFTPDGHLWHLVDRSKRQTGRNSFSFCSVWSLFSVATTVPSQSAQSRRSWCTCSVCWLKPENAIDWTVKH